MQLDYQKPKMGFPTASMMFPDCAAPLMRVRTPQLSHREQRVLELWNEAHVSDEQSKAPSKRVSGNDGHVAHVRGLVLEAVRGFEPLAARAQIHQCSADRRERAGAP